MARRKEFFLAGVERRNIDTGFLTDLYHNLITKSWARLLGLVGGVYIAANVVFATLYRLGGDCVTGVGSFRDLFFFSVQTMSTIGYGTMAPKTTWAHLLVTAQAFGGTLFVALVTGLVFAKFSRPTARVRWAKHVVIFERGGKRMLQVRMANERANQIVEAQLRIAFVRNEVTPDGEKLRRFYDLPLQRDRSIFFVLSWTATHEIDDQSPLQGLTLPGLKEDQAQLVCSLVGLDETFSQQVHSRATYSPDDLVFDRRFADIISNSGDGTRVVDYAFFDQLVPIGTKEAA